MVTKGPDTFKYVSIQCVQILLQGSTLNIACLLGAGKTWGGAGKPWNAIYYYSDNSIGQVNFIAGQVKSYSQLSLGQFKSLTLSPVVCCVCISINRGALVVCCVMMKWWGVVVGRRPGEQRGKQSPMIMIVVLKEEKKQRLQKLSILLEIQCSPSSEATLKGT